MTLIRKLIDWFKRLFRKLFHHKSIDKSKKIVINKKNSKHYINSNVSFDGSLPSYMIISDKDKEKLIYSITVMLKMLEEQEINKLEKDKKVLIDLIKNNESVDIKLLDPIISGEKELDTKYLNLLIKNFSEEDKKSITYQYQLINEKDKEFKVHVNEVDKVINLIEKKNISIIAENEINREIDNLNDKNNSSVEKIDKFDKKVVNIINNIDNDFLNEVVKQYKVINYVTISTTIIDKNYEVLKKLEDDYKNRRFNKYYYGREINKIKQELNKIKNLKNNKEVNDHIQLLKKELYTKSKDKYDLLYNNEVFINFNSECDKLLEKINTKVIDIKKEEKTDKTKETKNKYVENIILRFQDMELARNLILQNYNQEIELSNPKDILNYVYSIYDKFNLGIDDIFNFKVNKTRAELVILYNDLNFVISKLKKEPYIFVDHINFRESDLIEATMVKNSELVNLMKKNNIENDGSLIEEKMELLANKDKKKKNKILKKSNN